MRGRAAARAELSLTVKPRAAVEAAASHTDEQRARWLAWGAMLVSAAAVAGYLLGPAYSDSPASPTSAPSIEPGT